MKQKLASLDIGSYTARMLIAFRGSNSHVILPVSRAREYISIADYFDEESGTIKREAINRVAGVVNSFVLHARQEEVDRIFAVGTGLIRRAINREEFITRLKEITGIEIIPISGEQEAYLTAIGAIYSLRIGNEKSLAVIDLGGGSTEFFIKRDGKELSYSIPIGAAFLHNKYISSDPPKEHELYKVCAHIKGVLKGHLKTQDKDNLDIIVGTGGTVTALGALVHGISMQDISAERINGRVLQYKEIRDLLERLRNMDLEQKIHILGLDKKRAKVIIAGTIILMNILDLFCSEDIIVSLSDLLEGILLKPQIIQEEI